MIIFWAHKREGKGSRRKKGRDKDRKGVKKSKYGDERNFRVKKGEE
jgi:hypothetical protein